MYKQISKIIIFIIILSFSFNASAQGENNLDTRVDIECSNFISSLDISGSGNEISFDDRKKIENIKGMIGDCGYDLLINNTSNRLMYFLFGDVYIDALLIGTKPFEILINKYLEIMLGKDKGNFSFNSDEIKLKFSNQIIMGGVFSSMIGAVVIFINVALVLIVAFVIGKKIIKYQTGEVSAQDSKDILKFFTGISMVAPLPFTAGYSVVQFVFMVFLSLGILIANVFFIFVHMMLISAQFDAAKISYTNNYEEFNNANLASITREFDKSIRSNMCIIDYTEKMTDKNITKPLNVKKNMEMDFNVNPNFFNCLSSFKFAGESITSTVERDYNKSYYADLYDNCAADYNYYFNDEGKNVFYTSSSPCGKYKPIDIEENNYDGVDAIAKMKDLLSKFSFGFAKQHYYEHCKKRVSGEVPETFKCATFGGLGQYNINDEGEVMNTPAQPDITDREVLENKFSINENLLPQLRERVNQAYSAIIGAGLANYLSDSFIIKEFKEREIVPAIKNGWLSSAMIFIPKDLKSIFDLASEAEEELGYTQQEKINYIVGSVDYSLNDGFALVNYDTGLISYYDKEVGIYPDKESGWSFLDILEPTTLKTECMLERDCDYGLASTYLNPIEIYNSLGQDIMNFALPATLLTYGINTFIVENNKLVDYTYYVFLAFSAFAVFAIYILPMIPFFVFVSAILNWLFKVFKSPILVQIFAINYLIPDEENQDFTSESGSGYEKKIYKLFIEMMITPLFIVIGILVTFFVNFLALNILNYSLNLAFSGFILEYQDGLANHMMALICFIVYIFLVAGVIIKISTSMLQVLKMTIQYLELDSFDDTNSFNTIISAMQKKLLLNA